MAKIPDFRPKIGHFGPKNPDFVTKIGIFSSFIWPIPKQRARHGSMGPGPRSAGPVSRVRCPWGPVSMGPVSMGQWSGVQGPVSMGQWSSVHGPMCMPPPSCHTQHRGSCRGTVCDSGGGGTHIGPRTPDHRPTDTGPRTLDHRNPTFCRF